MLNDDLLLLIVDYLIPKDIISLSIVFPKNLAIKLIKDILPWEKLFPYVKKTTLTTIPILDIGNREGYTGYIDFITCGLMTASTMKGIDKHNRPFISIRFRQNDIIQVLTLFKRYSDLESLWVTNSIELQGYEGVNKLHETFGKMLSEIINNPHKPYYYTYGSPPIQAILHLV